MEKNRIMLDTSAYSAFLRGNPEIKLSLQQADEIFLNPIILGKLLAGFIMGKSEKKNRTILQEFLSSPRVKVTDIDDETSERYAVIINYLHIKGTPNKRHSNTYQRFMDSCYCHAARVKGSNH